MLGRLLGILHSGKSEFVIADFFVHVFSILFVLVPPSSACQGESSHLVILLHCCLGQSGTTEVPPGRDQQPIPFFLAKGF